MKKAFTLIELIFAIVIIGVLAAVAVPQFSGLSDNSKIASELSTAASVQAALDACHGEWIINEGSFTCGANIDSSSLNANGYPTDLGSPLGNILKNGSAVDWTVSGGKYYGPASKKSGGTTKCKTNKPCIGKYWDYNATNGTFMLKN